MKKTKEALKLVFYNWQALAEFEIIYKLASVIFFVPFLVGAFNLAMMMAGYSYLTLENVVLFILKPVTLVILAAIFLLAAIYAMLDISACVFALDQSVQKNRVSFGQILWFSVRNSIRIWRRKNVLIVPVVLLVLPFVNIGLASSFLTTISIPEFILDFILANRLLSVLFAALVAGLTMLSVRWLYAFFYFTLEGCSFSDARRKSVLLGKGKRITDFVRLVAMELVIALGYIFLNIVLIAAASLLGKILSKIFLIGWLGSTVVWLAVVLSLIVVASLSVPLGYGCVGILYYSRKQEKGEEVRHTRAPRLKERPRVRKILKAILSCFAVVVAASGITLGFLIYSGKLNPNIEYLRMMEITAHRGASVYYPENTMAAFRGAKEKGADWAELDVQQSKDGQIFVSHDTNFLRVTGVDANSWEMTYDDIAKLDAGSFFSREFAGERIPLLSEVVSYAKANDLKLNIELKPTGYETDFEKDVVDIIRNADFADRCVITSQVYEVLENVKAYDPEIVTVYVMSLAYGDINQLAAADHFSVESMNASESMISTAHNAGKQVYVWTVNTKESINRMIELNVDNIITDDIELAKKCVYESRYSSLLEEFLKVLNA